MLTQITEAVYTTEELRAIKFSDAFINRQLREHELGEIYFFARLGLIKNTSVCIDCLNEMQLTKKKGMLTVIYGSARDLAEKK